MPRPNNVADTARSFHEGHLTEVAWPMGVALSMGSEFTAALPPAAEVSGTFAEVSVETAAEGLETEISVHPDTSSGLF